MVEASGIFPSEGLDFALSAWVAFLKLGEGLRPGALKVSASIGPAQSGRNTHIVVGIRVVASCCRPKGLAFSSRLLVHPRASRNGLDRVSGRSIVFARRRIASVSTQTHLKEVPPC